MNETLGKRFARLRKSQGYTQEDIAEKLNVSPQAVSKWENDYSAPDISLLVLISELFNVTTDALLGKNVSDVSVVPAAERKSIDKMFFRIIAKSKDGEYAKINIPLIVFKTLLNSNLNIGDISNNEAIKNIDFEALFLLIEEGVIGKIMEAESNDGDSVVIMVE